MTIQEIYSQRIALLKQVLRNSFGVNRHSDGFGIRLLMHIPVFGISEVSHFDDPQSKETLTYTGYPEISYLGYRLGGSLRVSDGETELFIDGLRRMNSRSASSLDTLMADDIALLGLADGLSTLINHKHDFPDLKEWLVKIIEQPNQINSWSHRCRLLCAELLKPNGRLVSRPDFSNTDEMALEIALRNTWKSAFKDTGFFDSSIQGEVLRQLLTCTPPLIGDQDRAIVWLRAINDLVNEASQALIPKVSDVVRILTNSRGALKRWVWKAKSKRRAAPSQWLIDEESDVQSFLWAILFPIFQDLVDETYLPNFGFTQPRADLGIPSLKLLIEVKMAREPSDFSSLEGQIGEDLGLYFKDTNLYTRMIVFVYDDSDKPRPERYDTFRRSILNRDKEKIEEVIILNRPSMIPDRNKR